MKKLQFKKQPFQEEAAQAVVDVFRGQPYSQGFSFIRDLGNADNAPTLELDNVGTFGVRNDEINSQVDLKKNIEDVQFRNGLEPKAELDERYLSLTIEMETGTGKTYTYIKTMFELHKQYGWSKYIIVVPSIAIREGVLHSFQVTSDHFAAEYNEHINYFVYNSEQLNMLDLFASDNRMQAMIINSQAFNARGEAARRIDKELDSFRSRKPIAVVAATRPILIIDEPQSVLGANRGNVTRQKLLNFNPLFALRYSATHRDTDKQNMIYRLDAIDAYNRKLVKEINVRGVVQVGTDASTGFVFLQEIVLTPTGPKARIVYEKKQTVGSHSVTELVDKGFDLYSHSGQLEEYRDHYVIDEIDGLNRTISFRNGIHLREGERFGAANEELIRRIQIRETIAAHLRKERKLYYRGIKVLSLFFIDHVDNYRCYDGGQHNGKYADIFEEEYRAAIERFTPEVGEDEYVQYLCKFSAENVHNGYFSRDKRTGHFTNGEEKNKESQDESAYDLIMTNKERLLDMNEPTRFIFSHSALKEGWDNPNVFQICTLKDSDNQTKKRQEVGRGMRLCVNQAGERQDSDTLGSDVFAVNNLTVIASESYTSFAEALQQEIADAVPDRPICVTPELFHHYKYIDSNGKQQTIEQDEAKKIYHVLKTEDYVDCYDKLTKKYFDDKEQGKLNFTDEFNPIKEVIVKRLNQVYNPSSICPKDDRKIKEGHFISSNFDKQEFQTLWRKINQQTYYTVSFETEELVKKSIERIDKELVVSHVRIEVGTGTLGTIRDRQQLELGDAFIRGETNPEHNIVTTNNKVVYDLIGKLVETTNLTRRAVVDILKGIKPVSFDMFKVNPEEFIQRVGAIINSQKAISVVESITYHRLDKYHESNIFTANAVRGILGENAIESTKSLYDLVVVDSKTVELPIAEELEKRRQVVVYTKLPHGFYINTPMGHYNPDWAIVFEESDELKHIYFVAESKGTLSSVGRRDWENKKIDCARKHFQAIAGSDVVYDVITNYSELLDKVMR